MCNLLVNGAGLHQFFMCANPGNSAFVQNDDLVCIHDRTDTLCDQNNSGTGCFLF